jgi:hypothetical protein
MQWLTRHLGFVRRFAQTFGPYLLVEILLPGGSLIALALFIYQQRRLPLGLGLLTGWCQEQGRRIGVLAWNRGRP